MAPLVIAKVVMAFPSRRPSTAAGTPQCDRAALGYTIHEVVNGHGNPGQHVVHKRAPRRVAR
jgi:hypothetical protein